ncbi:hypothetical protein DFH09DRAFT_1128280 [Mycena vulgaris]|nr:hypothetical protein DFH09DRAFT_1128280 [Mycena vulgaris]
MSSKSTFPIVTPDTPLAFLDHRTGLLFEASSYLYIATLSAYIWELFSSVPEEVKIIRDTRLSLPIFAYFLSRIGTLGFLLTSTIFQVANVEDCEAVQVAMGWCFAVAVPASASLFFFRIAAVFNTNKPLVLFFLLAWIATLAGSIAIQGEHIASTSRCINTAVKPFAAAGTIANAITDTLIFVALSWRLSLNGMSPGLSARSQSFVRGRGLPKLSKALLQRLNILTMVMFSDVPIPPIIHAILAIPNVAPENAMACRVFRALRLGFIAPDSENEITTSVLWTSFVVSPGRVPEDVLAPSNNHTLRDMSRGVTDRVSRLDIQVSKSLETDDVGPVEDLYSRKASQGAIV